MAAEEADHPIIDGIG